MLKNMKAYSKVKFNSKLLKDEGFGRFSKDRSMCVDDDDDENAISKKPLLLIAQDTQ